MHLGRYIFVGSLIGLAACIWLTLAQPRTLASLRDQQNPPTPIATKTPSDDKATPVKPSVAARPTIKLLNFGVKLAVIDPVDDLVYGEVRDGGNIWAGFTTKSLLAKYPDCVAGSLGTLVRTKAAPTTSPSPSPSSKNTSLISPTPFTSRTPTSQSFKKTIAGYTYSYRPSYSVCAGDTAGRNTIAAAKAAIINGVLPTMSEEGTLKTP